MRNLVVLIVVVLAAQGSVLANSGLAVDEVRVVGDQLGWDGIVVGATRASVERALHRKLVVSRAEVTLVCGEFESRLNIKGHRVEIQWSSPDSTAVVDSVTVYLGEVEAAMNAIVLSARLTKRWPALRPKMGGTHEAGFASLSVAKNPELVVLINAAEGYIFVSSEGCVD